MHDLPLITTIATAFTVAWLLGLLAQRLALPPIVGYLLAGMLIGPSTPGFIGDVDLARQLADIGVILLMFGVGLHFDLKDLLAVQSVAVPGAIIRALVATCLGAGAFAALGLPAMDSWIVGMALAVASSVVLMRVLLDANAIETPAGHMAVAWSLVEDLLTVVVLVLIPVLGAEQSEAAETPGLSLVLTLGWALAKLLLLVIIVLWGGRRLIPWILVQVARLRSRELFTLTILVFSIAIAAASFALFGASMALGAFLAGMVVGQSSVSHQAAADALPLRDAFAVLFFVSVGMLFNPSFVFEQPLMILAALVIILLVKPITALAILAAFGQSAHVGLTVAVGLAQIGEFSFILAELAHRFGLMADAGHSALVAAAIITITVNPLMFNRLPAIENWLRRHPRWWSLLNARAERRTRAINQQSPAAPNNLATNMRRAVVVGFGPVGRTVSRLLDEAGLATIVIDMNLESIAELKGQGRAAIFGDASREAILEQAGVRHASYMLITLPDAAARAAVLAAARNLNPRLRVLVRARYLRERAELEQLGATAAVFEEAEAAVGLARLALAETGANAEVVENTVRDLRLHLIRENLSNLHNQRVRSVMVPWTRVERISAGESHEQVLRRIAKHRFSRWPVVDPRTGKPLGYLLTKDLIAEVSTGADWKDLIRPLQTVDAESDIETTLLDLQISGRTVVLVEADGIAVGMLTIEDILEQVVGQIEDEYPRDAKFHLSDVVQAGGIVLDLFGNTAEEAIAELAATIPAEKLPAEADVSQLALERERTTSTNLGVGVAIPHARCPHLTSPLIVFGRSREGIAFESLAETVYLVFLLVTPADKPDVQVLLLAQLAALVGNLEIRDRLLQAQSPAEVIQAIANA